MNNSTKVIYENPKYILSYNSNSNKYCIYEKSNIPNENDLNIKLIFEFEHKGYAFNKYMLLTNIYKGLKTDKELEQLGFIEDIIPRNGLRPIQFEVMDKVTIGWFHQWYVSKEFNQDTRRIDETLLALIELKDGSLVTRKFDKVKFLDVVD